MLYMPYMVGIASSVIYVLCAKNVRHRQFGAKGDEGGTGILLLTMGVNLAAVFRLTKLLVVTMAWHRMGCRPP